MLSHLVTSSRLSVHFAMEQHLLAATPGVLRNIHFFVLFHEATGDLAKLEFVPAQKCAQKTCAVSQVHFLQNTCCKTNCQQVAVLKTFELRELFCHGRLPDSLVQQKLTGKNAAMQTSLIKQPYSQCENQSVY